jgi:hypothetical protein
VHYAAVVVAIHNVGGSAVRTLIAPVRNLAICRLRDKPPAHSFAKPLNYWVTFDTPPPLMLSGGIVLKAALKLSFRETDQLSPDDDARR